MNTFDQIWFLLVFVGIISESGGKIYSLICPTDFGATGQAWYAETPNNIQTDSIKSSDMDFTKELTSQTSHYKPDAFLVCVICLYNPTVGYKREVEICIGKESLRKNNLAYERRLCSSGDNSGTLGWFDSKKPIGLEVEMSNGDLLSTLKTIQAIANTSLQQEHQNCPTGLKLTRIEKRDTIDLSYYSKQCIICNGDSLTASSCVSRRQPYEKPSHLLPSLAIIDEKCPWNPDSTSYCQLDVEKILKGNQSPCGLLMSPYDFLYNVDDFKAELLNFDCVNIQLKG